MVNISLLLKNSDFDKTIRELSSKKLDLIESFKFEVVIDGKEEEDKNAVPFHEKYTRGYKEVKVRGDLDYSNGRFQQGTIETFYWIPYKLTEENRKRIDKLIRRYQTELTRTRKYKYKGQVMYRGRKPCEIVGKELPFHHLFWDKWVSFYFYSRDVSPRAVGKILENIEQILYENQLIPHSRR